MINYLVGIGVAIMTIVIIYNHIKKIKNGNCGCGSNCSSCPFSNDCKDETEKK